MMIIDKVLPTTVVGSYPVVRKDGGLRAVFDPLRSAMETAVADQRRAGVDIISDGQVRADMIAAFTARMPGIRGNAVMGVVSPPAKPVTLGDTKYALRQHSSVKGIITGPSTLSHALKIETPAYRDRSELILDLARALAREARLLCEAGVTILQIDEPILSTGAADLGIAREAVRTITAGLPVPTCLHVCGDLGSVIDDLLKMEIRILDIECANNPDNLELFSGHNSGEKMLGLGVIDSADIHVESLEVVIKRIERGIDVLGPEHLLIDPDCGLRMLTREVAFRKLETMVQAADVVRSGL
jgi:5-methyltetrahydropteroyltriglutamate--homocysteine methyltransferase